jgi:hypothetical protein
MSAVMLAYDYGQLARKEGCIRHFLKIELKNDYFWGVEEWK